ncbi:type I polyketide synthase [Bacillus gaemokensis]|uniref:type I polyketide synthase n=1 Tax=Bacillus gaemokensis TaxID=574375 RepID=UPI00068DB3D4|nr:type I polyketide synthase [Bacillus gaemokensis]KYG37661.1 hypothetical protein AZF08_23055 [Bacillus gaemokensis]
MKTGREEQNSEEIQGIAIISMAGRFPGANNIQKFWDNLQKGEESITFFEESSSHRNAAGVIEGADAFDANFFDMSPREAEYTDPQHRLFLECAYEALEIAGYIKPDPDYRIGVYAGSGQSGYLLNVLSQKELVDSIGDYQLSIGNLPDFLTTRVSYKCNLNGPSMAIQTACSSSLVAVHAAVQALLTYECDMALAGGVSVKADQTAGLTYQEGGVLSEDGHCKAFDADAKGTVLGNGVGVVFLKRVEDAIEDGDQILAVIRGTAINNDGSQKIGYTAPSVIRQAEVIKEALSIANIDPETITYVEAHGTGTALGDPVEVAALTEAYGHYTSKKSYCALGSVKTNIGHLDSAAGIVGLIKVVLSMQNKKIPATLHFRKPNPKIDFDNSPFYVNTQSQSWDTDGHPRRAGISSFGMGGTNAHIILEEYIDRDEASNTSETERKLLFLSAKTPTALQNMVNSFIHYLQQDPQTKLSDIAYTLSVGREEFEYRLAALAYDRESAIKTLKENAEKWSGSQVILKDTHQSYSRSVVFMFPAHQSVQVNMGEELYRNHHVFRERMDQCSELLKPLLLVDIRDILYPSKEKREKAAIKLTQMVYVASILFAVEYALAHQWREWGVRQEVMVGHGVGEYVAACLAGVMTVEEALKVITVWASLIQEESTELCVDSPAIEVMVERLKNVIDSIQLKEPKISYISGLTGRWITNEQATDPSYWLECLIGQSRVGDGTLELLKADYTAFLEMGNGDSLIPLIQQQSKENSKGIMALSALPKEGDDSSSFEQSLHILGELWCLGIHVDRTALYKVGTFRRVPLPTYPFERKKYFIERNQSIGRFLEIQKRSERKNPHEDSLERELTHMEDPKNEVEEKIQMIWENLLGVQVLGKNENFFDLGGDSLLAIQLVTRLRENFDPDISMDIIFNFPTIGELTIEIEGNHIDQEDLNEIELLLKEIENLTEKSQ